MYFEIVSASGGYRWRIRGGNNEIMAVSEVLTTKASCTSAIAVVKANARTAPTYDRTA
jgi:uncharacterized protein YegP (UPF0339 family)